MKELILKITYDDTNGYKGHGEDTEEIIINIIERELKYDLEEDNVIDPNWKVEKIVK